MALGFKESPWFRQLAPSPFISFHNSTRLDSTNCKQNNSSYKMVVDIIQAYVTFFFPHDLEFDFIVERSKKNVDWWEEA